MADAIANQRDALVDDPLFVRLRAIRETVESGSADAETVARWNELRDTVAAIVASLRTTMRKAAPHERDKVAREWIEAFTETHWPRSTQH